MKKRKSLSMIVAESLTERIRSGALSPGAQLPIESELCEHYEVSRTVVREAVARLRSDGLIDSQQGRGSFVTENLTPRTFSIPEEALRSLPETVALLELRMSIEVEAAGLCAERRTAEQANAIRSTMERVDARQVDPDAIEAHYDYDFHLQIAEAARNEFMHGFLGYLRPIIVPRLQLGHVIDARLKDAYYARIHAEHEAIVDAIERQDGPAARRAMRTHLSNSLDRVRALAAASRAEGTKTGRKRALDALFAELARPVAAEGRPHAASAGPGVPQGPSSRLNSEI